MIPLPSPRGAPGLPHAHPTSSVAWSGVMAACCVLAGAVSPAAGQWSAVGPGPNDWNNTANWTGGTINNTFSVVGLGNQTVSFGADTVLTGALTITANDADLVFQSVDPTPRVVTLGGNIDINVGSATRTFRIGDPGAPLEVALGANRTFNVQGGNALLVIDAVVSGGFNITKAQNGAIRLNGLNTYTGTTTINRGDFILGNDAPSGAAGALGNATSAVLLGNTTNNVNSALLVAGAFTVGRDITVRASGGDGTGTRTIGGSTAAASFFTGNITLAKSVILQAAANGTVTFSGLISETTVGSGISKNSTGAAVLTNTGNSFTGLVEVNAGNLVAVGDVTAGVNGVLGNSFGAIQVGNLTNANAGRLLIGGAFTINRDILIRGGGTGVRALGGNTADASFFTGAVTLNAGLTVQAVSGGTATINGVISESSGSFALTKTGAGTVVLGVANNYSGGTIINQGVLHVAADDRLGLAGTPVLFSGAGVLRATSSFATDRSFLLTADGNLRAAGGVTLTTTGLIDGAGALAKSGAGILELNQAAGNSHAGGTNVNVGTLLAGNTTGSATGFGNVVVAAGATLGGTGRIAPNVGNTVTIDGILAPGPVGTVGTLTVDGSVIFGATGSLAYEANGLADIEHDLLAVTSGDVTLAGGFSATITGPWTPVEGDVLGVISNSGAGALTGTFDGLADGAVVGSFGGFDWVIRYAADFNAAQPGLTTFGGGNDVVLVAGGTVVPEPGTAALAVLGAVGALAVIRSARRRNPSRPAPSRPVGRSVRRGFTMIELLIVVAVIALLSVLVLAALTKVRTTARRAKCASNSGQIVKAAMARADADPLGLYVPTPTRANDNLAWLHPGFLGAPDAATCPDTENVVYTEGTDGRGQSAVLPDANSQNRYGRKGVLRNMQRAARGPHDSSGGHSYEIFAWFDPGYWPGALVVDSGNRDGNIQRGFAPGHAMYEPDINPTRAEIKSNRRPTGKLSRTIFMMDADIVNAAENPLNVKENWPDEGNNHGEDGLNIGFLDGHAAWVPTGPDLVETYVYSAFKPADIAHAKQVRPGFNRIAGSPVPTYRLD